MKGVHTLEDFTLKGLKHSYQVANRAYNIISGSRYKHKFNDVDILIALKELEKFGMFNLKNIDVIFKIGYESAIKALSNHN